MKNGVIDPPVHAVMPVFLASRLGFWAFYGAGIVSFGVLTPQSYMASAGGGSAPSGIYAAPTVMIAASGCILRQLPFWRLAFPLRAIPQLFVKNLLQRSRGKPRLPEDTEMGRYPRMESMVACAFSAASTGSLPVMTSLKAREIASEICGQVGSGPRATAYCISSTKTW